MTKAESTKARATEVGLSLVSSVGLASISIARVAEQAGLSKSGLFAHFGSKDALQIEILLAAARLAEERVFGPSDPLPPGLPKLRVFFESWLGWAQRAGLPGGCPFAAAAFEFDDVDGPVRNALIEIQRRLVSRIELLVEEAIGVGELRPEVDPSQMAWEIMAIYTGHHVSQRLLRDNSADQRAMDAFGRLTQQQKRVQGNARTSSPV